LIAQEIGGAGAMSSALLKQVIVALLRRSLRSFELWVERFAMLSDPQIARAFSAMAAHPGARHTTRSLAEAAALSRSAFMARFTVLIGRPPMAVLRDLRMQQAAQLLKTGGGGIERIAETLGYASQSRAFRQAFGTDPCAFRSTIGPS
jgi:AraC family transcriptional activator of mtrCDE